MRAVLALMLCLAGCQFQVASSPGGVTPDLATSGAISGAPVQTAPADDLAQSRTIADLSVAPPPAVAAQDMALPFKPSSAVGAACKTSSECGGDGLVCVDQVGLGKTKVQFPGGHCTRDCSNVACPTDSVCAKEGGVVNLCMAKCPPASCRPGYRCCSADAVCAPENSCN